MDDKDHICRSNSLKRHIVVSITDVNARGINIFQSLKFQTICLFCCPRRAGLEIFPIIMFSQNVKEAAFAGVNHTSIDNGYSLS